jgi:hypothetical protein
MKDLIQASTVFIVVVALIMGIFVWLVGSTALIIGLSVIGLLLYGAMCAIAGAWWTERAVQKGASLSIDSASKNDAHDAQKMDALAGLVEAVVKGYAQTQNSMLKTTQLPQFPYPELPEPSNVQKALRFDDAVFEELD